LPSASPVPIRTGFPPRRAVQHPVRPFRLERGPDRYDGDLTHARARQRARRPRRNRLSQDDGFAGQRPAQATLGAVATRAWNQGSEMAQHDQLAPLFTEGVYCAHPGSPWLRPTNENTNGLLCQYLPKKTGLRSFTAADLITVQDRLNHRPRKRHGWGHPQTCSPAPSENLDRDPRLLRRSCQSAFRTCRTQNGQSSSSVDNRQHVLGRLVRCSARPRSA
jgi:hypothetical protein